MIIHLRQAAFWSRANLLFKRGDIENRMDFGRRQVEFVSHSPEFRNNRKWTKKLGN